MRQKISITINEKTLKDIDSVIDSVYIKNRSQAIEHLVNHALGENKQAVILLGGDERHLDMGGGTLRPLGMLKGKTVIEHALLKLRDTGFKTIYLVARHKVLTKIFEVLRNGDHLGITLHYTEEKNAKGSFESLKEVKGKITQNFLVVYGDLYFSNVNIEELWNDHIRHQATATIMLTTSATPREKGTVKVEGTKVLEFTQKPKKSDIYLVFSPIFAAEPEIFEYEGKILESEVFPQLVEKGLLNGHLSSEKEKHIHEKKDLK